MIFFSFCSEENTDQADRLFCIIQGSTSNTVFSKIFLNARENGVFRIGSLVDIVNTDPIEYYMNGVPIIISKNNQFYATNESLTDSHAQRLISK